MYKSALGAAPRRILSSRPLVQNAASRRFLSTAPPTRKSRSWKSSAVRWGLAIGGVYYLNTSNVFAEEPEAAIQRLDESLHRVHESNLPTVDAIVEEKRQRQAQRIAEERREEMAAKAALAGEGEATRSDGEGEDGLEGLEEDADQQGAFNPETGEINWDCPCLGGMAHGPCGEEFKAAFSCFVYSNEEPKGVECIEKFKGMQDCFRQHPETYASEFEDDEDVVEEELRERDASASTVSAKASEPSPKATAEAAEKPVEQAKRDVSNVTPKKLQKSADEEEELVPRAAHDATSE